MSKTTKKTTTAKPAAIQCNNTACKFCGITGFCFAHPGDTCPEGKIKAPAPVQEPAKVQETAPAPVKTKTLEERIKERAAKMGINPAKVIVSTVTAAPVKAPAPEPVKAQAADPTPAHKVRKPRAVKTETAKAPEPAPVKKSPYTDHLADWKDDTARNLHSEVRVKIAAWCATTATAEADEFALLHADYLYILEESTNGITPELQDFRLELDDELFERIKRVFGEKAATEIHGCL